MKSLLILIALVITYQAKAADCYTALLSKKYDSAHHQIYAEHIDQDYTNLTKEFAKKSVEHLMSSLHCRENEINVFNVKCTDDLGYYATVCKAEIKYGYFMVTRDMMDNINLIFNRWD